MDQQAAQVFIDEILWYLIIVGRPVMAVQAIHGPYLQRIHLSLIQFIFRIFE